MAPSVPCTAISTCLYIVVGYLAWNRVKKTTTAGNDNKSKSESQQRKVSIVERKHMVQFPKMGKFDVLNCIKLVILFEANPTCSICSVTKYHDFGL